MIVRVCELIVKLVVWYYIAGDSIMKKNFLEIGFLYFENVLRLFYSLFSIFLIKTLVSAVEFANLTFYLSLAILIYGLSKFQLDSFITKEIVLSKNKSEQKRYFQSIVIFRFVFTSFLAVLFVSFLGRLDKLYGVVVLLVFFQIFRFVDGFELYLRAINKIYIQAKVRVLSLLVPIIVLIILSLFNNSLSIEIVVFVLSLEWIVILIFYGQLIFKEGFLYPLSIDKDTVMKFWVLLVGAIPVYIGHAVNLLYSRLDQFFLESIVSVNVYGEYMLAARLNDASIMLTMTLNLYFFPKLVKLYKENRVKFESFFRKISFLYFCFSVACISIVWFVKYNYSIFVDLGLGDFIPYRSLDIFSYMTFNSLILFSFSLRSTYYILEDETKYILYGSLLGAGVVLIVGLPLMIFFGVTGAIISTILGNVFALIIVNCMSKNGIDFLKLIFNVRSG